MGHMEVTDIFRVLDGNHLTQFSGIHNILQCTKEIGIAKNMAHSDFSSQAIGLFLDLQALHRIRGDRFFQKNIIAAVQRLHHMTKMIPIHGGNDRRIRDFPQGKQIIYIRKSTVSRNIPLICSAVQPVNTNFRDSSNLNSMGMCPISIDGSPGSGANHDILHKHLLVFLFSIACFYSPDNKFFSFR